MSRDEVIAELRLRIRRAPAIEARERWSPERQEEGSPWPSYYLGYRDALGELIEWLEERE